MKDLPFVQVYDVSLMRLRDSINYYFHTLEGLVTTPLDGRRQLGESIYFLLGAVHQWKATMQFLCELTADRSTVQRAALLALVNLENDKLEQEITDRAERLNKAKV